MAAVHPLNAQRQLDPIADIQEAVGPLDRVGPLVILPALGALEQFR
jgi:hypothetical protein